MFNSVIISLGCCFKSKIEQDRNVRNSEGTRFLEVRRYYLEENT